MIRIAAATVLIVALVLLARDYARIRDYAVCAHNNVVNMGGHK
jgi:hypothetical protein